MPANETIWAFDPGPGSTGDSPVALGDPPNALDPSFKGKLLCPLSRLIPSEFDQNKTGEVWPRRSCLRNAFGQVYPHGG